MTPAHGPESAIMDFLARSTTGPLKAGDIARGLGIPKADFRRFKRALTGMEKAGKIYRVKGHRFALSRDLELAVGSLSVTRAGDGFLRPDEGGTDVFIPGGQLDTAMPGDRVVARIESRPRGRSPVGSIIKVLERARETMVGTFQAGRRVEYVVPMDQRIHRDIVIPKGEAGGAEPGDVVVVRVVSFGEGRVGPVGTIEKVLGALDDPGVDVLAVAHGFGVSLDFPPEVTADGEEQARIGLENPGERTDHTDLLVLTIDPADAKDHDDALSVLDLGNGRVEVGVHIADVAHFVPEGGRVDGEALERGTSVYLVDRTIPMLPHTLSAGVCSLHEGEDRLAVSVFMELDRSGNVFARRFERTRIQVRRGLAYEDVQAVLDGEGRITPEIDDALRALDDIARGVRAERSGRGSLDLDLPEAKVILDDDGQPIDIQKRSRMESHRLVEDFMVLANEVVAQECAARSLPVLYRVHEDPPAERVEELRELLGRLGHRLPRRKGITPEDIQALLDAVRGRPEQALVSNVVLRSLAKARYDPANLGHFGLASEGYLHFTSPIRRYPDLVVHREVVSALVDGNPKTRRDAEWLQGVAERCSGREQSAAEAERASVAMKKVEFMERHLGDEMDGTVSGVQAFGFFVTLERYFVEGLVHVNSLRDDFYRLKEDQYALVGDRGRNRFRIGDRVRVQVAKADKESRHIDFLLVRKLRRAD